ncbi:CDP-alcohol phosphatidyltransferase superfamily protein [Babesia ovis]|uniref:CDP-alcohol phosphatidyltransferase superfamily protein n=1 Tax=Babesia ovis TaxID=5869 RepID=A0A9W5WUX2_BABOV|nr:CDP-alcohol phosphatidyltransferase superfamily protein [Babesia ovis]
MENLMRMIPKGNLHHLKNYKFHSGSSTPLDNLFNCIWWNPVSHLIPRFVSPNILTLTGALCLTVMNYCIFAYVPGLDSSKAPEWLPLVMALAIFLYMTLDGVDGKQARKLGISSPLGQLLDHGIDAVISVFYPYMCVTLFPGGYTYSTLLLFCSPPIHVLCTVWREKEFATFFHTNGVVGVTETNFLTICLHLLHYYTRPHMYKKLGALFGKHAAVQFVSRFFPRVADLYTALLYIIIAVAYTEEICGIIGLIRASKHRARFLVFICSSIIQVFSGYYMVLVLPPAFKVLGCLFASTMCTVICVNNIICLLAHTPLRSFHLALVPHYLLIIHYFGVDLLRNYGYKLMPLSTTDLRKLLLVITVYGFGCILYIFAKTISEIMDYLKIPLLTVPTKGVRHKAS